MRAVRIPAPGIVELVDVQAPVPGPGEVVVDVAYAGICASDVDIFEGRRRADLVRYPVIPGHEWSGTVAAVGAEVSADLVGGHVVGEGFRSCLSCPSCARGDLTLCEIYDETGFTAPGAWAEQLAVPARLVHVLADDADLRGAAGLEPAACAADAVRRAGQLRGQRVAVIGGGSLGQLVVQLVHALGPLELVVVEPDPRRAGLAERSGATAAVSPEALEEHRDRFDIVIEASGVAPTAQLAIDLARRGGRVVLTGMFDAAALISARDLVGKRLHLDSVFGAGPHAWADALRAFGSGALDPGALVTHELDLADAEAALALAGSRIPGTGKVLLRPCRRSPDRPIPTTTT